MNSLIFLNISKLQIIYKDKGLSTNHLANDVLQWNSLKSLNKDKQRNLSTKHQRSRNFIYTFNLLKKQCVYSEKIFQAPHLPKLIMIFQRINSTNVFYFLNTIYKHFFAKSNLQNTFFVCFPNVKTTNMLSMFLYFPTIKSTKRFQSIRALNR